MIGVSKTNESHVLDRKYWPEYLQNFEELKGIFVNYCGCGYGFDVDPPTLAHTHNDIGWMCVPRSRYLLSELLMMHEMAHILTNSGHNKKWRRKVLQLGGTLDSFQVSDGRWVRPYHKIIKRNDRLEGMYRSHDPRNSNQNSGRSSDS